MENNELVDPETFQQLNWAIRDGLKAEKYVCIFHQWIVTTFINDLPNIVDFTEEEEYMNALKK